MSVKERIKKFAKSQERSIMAFEKKAGLNIGYINAIRVSIQPEKIQSIASNYPNLNIDWLLTGKGEMLKFDDFNEQKDINEIKDFEDKPLNQAIVIEKLIKAYEEMLSGKERYIQSLERIIDEKERYILNLENDLKKEQAI